MTALVIRLLVCKLCVRDGVPPVERFRASDSEPGRRAISEHALETHAETYGTEER